MLIARNHKKSKKCSWTKYFFLAAVIESCLNKFQDVFEGFDWMVEAFFLM